jgi:hypothetical protein
MVAPPSPTLPCKPDVRPVSSQSALRTLIALALNAMTQEFYMDQYPSAVPFSPARSSPIICLADTFTTIFWTVVGVFSGHTIRFSFSLARRRLGLKLEDAEEGLKNDTPAVGITVFVLAALPQAVKLSGCSGVPWTKTWGLAYFVS